MFLCSMALCTRHVIGCLLWGFYFSSLQPSRVTMMESFLHYLCESLSMDCTYFVIYLLCLWVRREIGIHWTHI